MTLRVSRYISDRGRRVDHAFLRGEKLPNTGGRGHLGRN